MPGLWLGHFVCVTEKTGWESVYIPTHRKSRDGWGTRSVVAGEIPGFARMPTLATIRPSLRWGTRIGGGSGEVGGGYGYRGYGGGFGSEDAGA